MAAYVDPILESMDVGPSTDANMPADEGTSPGTLEDTSADERMSADNSVSSNDDDMSVEEGVSAEGAGVDHLGQVRDARDVMHVMLTNFFILITMMNRSVCVTL